MLSLRSTVLVFFILSMVCLPEPFAYQASYQEFNQLMKDIWASDQTAYPIGDLILDPQSSSPQTAYVVLYRLQDNQKSQYPDQLIRDAYIKALAMRVYSDMDDHGNIKSMTPMVDAFSNYRAQNPFQIRYPDSRIRLQRIENQYVLRTKLYVEFGDDIAGTQRYRILDLMKSGIEEAWQGKYDQHDFKTEVWVTEPPLAQSFFGRPDHFNVYISNDIKRSFVTYDDQGIRCGRWEPPSESYYVTKQLYAHEFGHFLGFQDGYTDVAYFDLQGHLLSKDDYQSISLQSSLRLLSPFAHITSFNKYPNEHYQNIMTSSRYGRVLPEHLDALMSAYAPMQVKRPPVAILSAREH